MKRKTNNFPIRATQTILIIFQYSMDKFLVVWIANQCIFFIKLKYTIDFHNWKKKKKKMEKFDSISFCNNLCNSSIFWYLIFNFFINIKLCKNNIYIHYTWKVRLILNIMLNTYYLGRVSISSYLPLSLCACHPVTKEYIN